MTTLPYTGPDFSAEHAEAIAAWNDRHPVGTLVLYAIRDGNPRDQKGVTEGAAFMLHNQPGGAVVHIDTFPRPVSLDRVEAAPVPPVPSDTDRLAEIRSSDGALLAHWRGLDGLTPAARELIDLADRLHTAVQQLQGRLDTAEGRLATGRKVLTDRVAEWAECEEQWKRRPPHYLGDIEMRDQERATAKEVSDLLEEFDRALGLGEGDSRAPDSEMDEFEAADDVDRRWE